MTPVLDFLATHQILTILVVLALGALLGQVRFGPLRFGAAGALFMGLVVGALDPRFGVGLGMIKSFGVVLFCYTVGLAAGSTFLSDLRRQWHLMVAGTLALVAMAAAALGLGRLLGLTPAHVAGLFAGVLTSPAIDAATSATHGAGDTLVGYALSYPTGVVVAMIVVALVARRRWPARKDNTSLAEAGITAVSTVVDRHTSIRRTPGFVDDQIRMSYLLRDGEMTLATPEDDLHPGDEVLVVGNPDDVARAVEHLGHVSDRRLTDQRQEIDFRRFLVSNPRLVGRTLGEIDVRGRTNGKVTRVRRGDLDMLARSDLVLQPGDRVLCVVPANRISDAADFFGDSEAGVSQVDALSLGLGAALGLALGALFVALPGGLVFELGAAAGPLVMGMVLGAVHRTGPIRWDLPHATNAILRQLGLMLFLACVGLASGQAFISQAASWSGLCVVAVSAVSLLLGAGLLLGAARLLDLSAQRATGAFAGFVGQPAILGYANSLVNDERIESAYGALFALGTIVKILLVQVIALV
ncbi:aspartate:alanine exchanger family transporter [Acidipropionibacterium timonense]|uniref:aspartate:alanine exchanger family transporter n=1 Tax=Acidipropionibacterium timonense TaxID=2161818 RepID=UPI00102F9E51|nr:TrkA C-terminal domain-containing protein [Acidipropionibacterium timonense]